MVFGYTTIKSPWTPPLCHTRAVTKKSAGPSELEEEGVIFDQVEMEKWFHQQEYGFTLLLFNIAMENGPFIDDIPIKTSSYKGCSMAMLNNQMVNGIKWDFTTNNRDFILASNGI